MLCFCFVQAAGQQPQPIDASLCVIAARPARFHNQTVRVRGTAVIATEASLLIESKNGKWNESCGRIWLDFGSATTDQQTKRFLQLAGEQRVRTCTPEEQLKQGMSSVLASSGQNHPPCVRLFCVDCPRYSIVATFTGRLRDAESQPGGIGFGHLNTFRLELEVETVQKLQITDLQEQSNDK